MPEMSQPSPYNEELPVPCQVGSHVPVIVHRTGGRSAEYYNVCGLCGEQIERCDGFPWMTAEQADQRAKEDEADARAEDLRRLEEQMEERCPPRE